MQTDVVLPEHMKGGFGAMMPRTCQKKWVLFRVANHRRERGMTFDYKPGKTALSYAGVPDDMLVPLQQKGYAANEQCAWVFYQEGE